MANVPSIERGRACGSCGTELAASLLVCPACGALVHRDRLTSLARDAAAATAAGEHGRALGLWRETLSLLPEGTRQHASGAEQISVSAASGDAALAAEVRKGPPPGSFGGGLVAPLGT